MSKKTVLFFVGLLCAWQARATTRAYLDSVEQALHTAKPGIERLNCLYTLSYEYGLIEPRKGIAYGYQCLAEATRGQDLLYQLNAYNGIANAYETLTRYDSARFFHRHSYEVAKKMNAPSKIALTLFNIALCYKQLGDYKSALSQYLAAYRLLEAQPSYNPRIHFYMGELYMRLGDYAQAEHHSRLGIWNCRRLGHDYVVYNMYVNLAKCYQKKGQTDSAVYLLNSAIKGLRENTDQNSLALALNALGELYMAGREYRKAFAGFSEELDTQIRLKSASGIFLACINLANIAAHLPEKSKALVLNFLNEAEERRPATLKNSDILIESSRKAGETYELIGEPQKALSCYKQYFALKDSLLNRDNMQQYYELQQKYEAKKKEQQILTLQQANLISSFEISSQQESIRKRNSLLLFGLIFFLLLGFLVYQYILKQKQKAAFEKELAVKTTEEKERLRIARDIHDDLGSGLSKISFLSELIMRNASLSDPVKENSSVIVETARKLIVNMRDLIWALDPGNVTLSGLAARIREYASDYLEDFPADLRLSISEELPETFITKESYRDILMTVKESLNNIVKHSKASRIALSFSVSENRLQVSVRDNGVGLLAAGKGGNGLRNMRTRIVSLGGSLEAGNAQPEGTLIFLEVPLEKIRKK